MEKLKSLVKIITPSRIKQISILSPSLSKDTKLMQLYNGIYYGKYQDDEEAIKDLYGEELIGSKYSKLKNDLEYRLVNMLLASDLAKSYMNERQKAYFKYFRIWTAGTILVRLGSLNYGMRLLEKIFKHLLKHEFTIMALESSRLLRSHYSRHIGDRKKGKLYDRYTKHLLQQYNAEVILGGYLEEIMVNYVKEKGNKAKVNEIIDKLISESKNILPQNPTGKIEYIFAALHIKKYMNIYDYGSAAKVCQESLALFEEKYPFHRTNIIIFIHQWIICTTQLKQYDTATQLIQKALCYLKTGEYNWFKLMEYKAQLALYKMDYNLAFDTYEEVIKHPALPSLPTPIQEEWLLYEAYTQFVLILGKADGGSKKIKRFKVQKFVNEISIFNQDKQGMNIPIIIIQMAYLVLYRRFHHLIDKAEGLEKYRQRYLSIENHERSNIFVRLFLLLIKCNFKPDQAEAKGKDLVEELSKIPLNIFTSDHEVEIIPYEHLWNMLLESLKKKEPPLLGP